MDQNMECRTKHELLEFIFHECAGLKDAFALDFDSRLIIKEPLPSYDYVFMAIKLLKEKFDIIIKDLYLHMFDNNDLKISLKDTELSNIFLKNIKVLPELPDSIEKIRLHYDGINYQIYIRAFTKDTDFEEYDNINSFKVVYQKKSGFDDRYNMKFYSLHETKREAIDSINEHLTELYERVFYD